MGTKILRPHGCLTQRIRVSPCRRRNFHYHDHGNATIVEYCKVNRKPADQRKRHQPEPSISKRSTSTDDLRISRKKCNHHSRNHSLVVDNQTILQHGESIHPADSKTMAEVAMTGQICSRRSDVYAGSAFAVSPDPNSLPLPSFSKKKVVTVDDCATRDLCRLLRLEL